jgi:ribosomal protein S18 acetylase RimI-like enzyme
MTVADAMTVRCVREDEVDAVAAMLTRAFRSTPLIETFSPDSARREEISRWLFTSNARYGVLYGEVWAALEDDGVPHGSAIWWAPEFVQADAERAMQSGLADAARVFDSAGMARRLEVVSTLSELHHAVMPDRHWYLAFLGVDPDTQGSGVAGQVLAPMLDRLDAERLPAFLETGQPRNVGYYRRYGFEVVGETVLPSSGLVFWGMRRNPR